MSLGKRIQDARKAKGLTLAQVASKLGISEASLQRYECGSIKNPKQVHLHKLAEVLEVDFNTLMGYDSPNSPNNYVSLNYADEDLQELVSIFWKLNKRQKHKLMVRAYELEDEMTEDKDGNKCK